MSDLNGTSGARWSDGEWLTPTGAAIAGFTIAVLSLLTNGAWVLMIQTFVSRNGSSALADIVIATGVVQGLVALGALVLARRGLAAREGAARNLGGATVVLGGLGLVVAFLTVVAGVVSV
jgi:hypothetical protein